MSLSLSQTEIVNALHTVYSSDTITLVTIILPFLSATDQLIRLHGVCNALPFKKFHVSVLNLIPVGRLCSAY